MAKNSSYFLGDKQGDISYTQGLLTKIALTAGDFTLEDSSIITERVSEDMSADITMMKDVVLGKNANILYIAKKHSHIKTGENLLIFESSFDDAEANQLLDSINDDTASFISELGRNTINSKYTGEIVDIKVYFNIPEEECSPSLQKLLKEYRASVIKRKKIIMSSDNNQLVTPPTEQIQSNKIKGRNIEGVLIEFYIKHKDTMKIGDKVVYGTALKTICSDVIPFGEEPYTESEPDEPINAILSQMSVVSRMTTDVYNQMYTNKLILGLKKKTREIWES